MFNNVGKKLKIIAKIIFAIYVLAAVAGSIVGAIFVSEAGEDILAIIIVPAGTLVGILLSWCLTVPLYAFGEIVFRLTSIDQSMNVFLKRAIQKDKADSEAYRADAAFQSSDNAYNYPPQNAYTQAYPQGQNAYAQAQNAYAQEQNNYAQAQNNYAQVQNTYAQAQNAYTQEQNAYEQSQPQYSPYNSDSNNK